MVTWAGDSETKPAPEPLARIQALVNTVDLENGIDRLADPADATPWLIDHELLNPGTTPTATELDLLRGVREALRALLVVNTGGPAPAPEMLGALRQVAEEATARAELGADGEVALCAVGDTVTDRLVELLVVMRDAQRDGTWGRLKACANDDCRWAFYDRSRNHGGSWCTMSVCGNKLKNRQFRARQRGQSRQ
ncbi:CGNR zinc finger domain-containing protein [Mycolicibacterium goodii]|uniref:Zn-ribbon-like motif protein n=1 Tax=Mycolicibacterium goodii TaxID=134601 RepID=A0A0K0X9R1_MYCGD|nr:Zn-ribbon-like motif protein [Mycolicibacterium goodii]